MRRQLPRVCTTAHALNLSTRRDTHVDTRRTRGKGAGAHYIEVLTIRSPKATKGTPMQKYTTFLAVSGDTLAVLKALIYRLSTWRRCSVKVLNDESRRRWEDLLTD